MATAVLTIDVHHEPGWCTTSSLDERLVKERSDQQVERGPQCV